MKKAVIITAVVLSVLLGLFAGMSYFIGTQVFEGSTQLTTNEDTTGVSDTFWERYGMDIEEFTGTYTVEKITITSSFDGHDIPADYIYAQDSEGTKDAKTVILVHGLGGNRLTNYPLAEFFLSKGCNVLTYDQRSSNENTAERTTFGFWEKYDLIDCIDYVRGFAPEQTVGVWGTSFGGATAGLALGQQSVEAKVDYLVLDCPVSSMRWMVEEEMRKMDTGLPVSYMTVCGDIVNRMELGFSYDDADVAEAMRSVDIPVLIINSAADTVTPAFMGQDIYNAILGNNKTIWTVEDSAHADVWLDYNEEYTRRVEELMNGAK